MHTFKDCAGGSWMLSITYATVERVQAARGVNMPGLVEELKGYAEFLCDDSRLIPVVYDCCIDAGDRTLEDLKAAWNGETADAAITAWQEELVNFFRSPQRRATLRELLAKMQSIGDRVIQKGQKTLETVGETEIDAAAEQVMARLRSQSATASSESSGSVPASSESTQDLSPSASS